jgi:hypothetical protein
VAHPAHVGGSSDRRKLGPYSFHPEVSATPMLAYYLPIFLLFMATLIAAYFYLERAKARDAGKPDAETTTAAASSSNDAAE